MTYVSPGPSVTENFLGASQTFTESELLPCVVGSLVQVVKNSPITVPFPITSQTVSYPGMKAGALINNASVVVQVANAVTSVLSTGGTGGSGTFGQANYVAPTALFTGTLPGDIVTFGNGKGIFTVNSVSTDGKTLTFSTNLFIALVSGDTFVITRNVGTVNATIVGGVFNTTSFTFTGLTYAGLSIIAGTCNVSYTAQRRDKSGFYSVTDPTTLAADMDIDPLNPLGFYLGNIVPAASGERSSLAYITPDNSENSYIAALAAITTNRDLYMVVPIVTNSAVNNDIAAHVNAMSQPTPGPSFYRAGIVPAMTVAAFLSKNLEANLTTTFAQCS